MNIRYLKYHFQAIRKMAATTVIFLSLGGCTDYLNVVPDNLATIDNAFVSADMAEKYLFTCYSYMPNLADVRSQSFLVGDEYWTLYPFDPAIFTSVLFETIALGNQNTVNPAMNYWDGQNGGYPMFVGIRTCNIFLEKINEVPEETFKPLWGEGSRTFTQKDWWVAEAKFLKAYYHYWLLRMYGPIPLIKGNLPVSSSVDQVQIVREPVDDCFRYIIELIDEAIPNLPGTIMNPTTETGRITKTIAYAMKAKILTEAASPLFNGNTDYATFVDPETKQPFFNQTYDTEKWVKAAEACRQAVTDAEENGFELCTFTPMPTDKINDSLRIQMNIRSCIAEGSTNLNREGIWLDVSRTEYATDMQRYTLPCIDANFAAAKGGALELHGTIKIAEMFYSDHGVPIEEDDEWMTSGKYATRYKLRTATAADRYNIKEGEQTASLHFDREARFYGNLSFDRCVWFGMGKYDKDNQYFVKLRNGDPAQAGFSPVTGYGGRKLINYQSTIDPVSGGGYLAVQYAWPIIRLADMYLLLSETLNEAYGPSAEIYAYMDKVRARAGLEGVVDSWSKYAAPALKSKPSTQEGLRDIIHRERLIEMYGEGIRYWDIRRWKRAKEMWHNQPVQGWDWKQKEPDSYYRVTTLFTQKFTTRDYLFPIKAYNLDVNKRLVQNPGWE